ncbi:protein TIC 40, chloroplastic-like [Hibiscus syriacus]|uniref:protein TIC 40, chloroplastic-like n=1 Tax=Hibiscus syriacus TaxID=106335 RepID=UPI001922E7DE|nr:protein TIC 40, chloroplastic-like [Hibiscus syriacus]
MENMNMALIASSCSPPKLYLLGHTNNNNPIYTLKTPIKIFTFPTSRIAPRRSRISCSAHTTPPRRLPQIVFRKSGDERFASISSSSNQRTSSVGVNPYPTVPPPSSQM